MHFFRSFSFITLVITLYGCEKNYSISTHANHYSHDKHFIVVSEQEILPGDIRKLISKKNENIDKPIKFPLAYYLIQEQDIQLIFNHKIDPNISDQLFMIVSGSKYYKLFVHPDLDESYSFLQNAYRYISPDQTEFFAISLSTPKTLVVWNQRSGNPRPFIINSKSAQKKSGVVLRLPAYQLEHPDSIRILLKKGPSERSFPIDGQEITSIPQL